MRVFDMFGKVAANDVKRKNCVINDIKKFAET